MFSMSFEIVVRITWDENVGMYRASARTGKGEERVTAKEFGNTAYEAAENAVYSVEEQIGELGRFSKDMDDNEEEAAE